MWGLRGLVEKVPGREERAEERHQVERCEGKLWLELGGRQALVWV